jgi:sigma-B regulation protein RsbU (phosphoserine phosphatase)
LPSAPSTHLEIRLLGRSLRDINQELTRKQQQLDEDLRAAANIQGSLIPPQTVQGRFAELALAWRFTPCHAVGGDAFNLFRLDQEHIACWVLDVSGHDVPAAMMTVSVSQCLTAQVGSALKKRMEEPPHYRLAAPHEVLEELDREFPVERFDKFFTMNYLVLNSVSGRLRHCRAAHPRPILARASGELEMLESAGTIIGLGGVVPYTQGETDLVPGDRVFIYSNGVLAGGNRWGERFGEERLTETVHSLADRDLQDVCDGVIDALAQFAGGVPPADDLAFVALEFRGRP